VIIYRKVEFKIHTTHGVLLKSHFITGLQNSLAFINDSFVVATCKKINSISYYLIQRIKDSRYAEEKDFLIGPLSEKEYNEEYIKRLKINLTKVQ
jgi:hypothetical protein